MSPPILIKAYSPYLVHYVVLSTGTALCGVDPKMDRLAGVKPKITYWHEWDESKGTRPFCGYCEKIHAKQQRAAARAKKKATTA